MSVASHHKSSAMQILVHSITLSVDSRGSSLPFIYKVSRANSIFEQFQRSLSPSALLKIIIAILHVERALNVCFFPSFPLLLFYLKQSKGHAQLRNSQGQIVGESESL